MKKTLLAIFSSAALIITLASCQMDDIGGGTDPDTERTGAIIFGHFHGMCQGETCVETFKIENGILYEDTNDDYSKQTPYTWVELTQEQYKAVEDIWDAVPDQLMQQPSQTFGMPDAYDQGGYYIEIDKYTNNLYRWRIDSNKEDIPEYLHPLIDAIREKVELLK